MVANLKPKDTAELQDAGNMERLNYDNLLIIKSSFESEFKFTIILGVYLM